MFASSVFTSSIKTFYYVFSSDLFEIFCSNETTIDVHTNLGNIGIIRKVLLIVMYSVRIAATEINSEES